MIYNLEYKDDMGNLLFVSAYVYVKIIEQIAADVRTLRLLVTILHSVPSYINSFIRKK